MHLALSCCVIDECYYRFAIFSSPSGSAAVPEATKRVLRSLELVSANVPCTDGARKQMRQQIRSLQIWHGLPSLFLTLNPADTKHPFTLYYSPSGALAWEPASSDQELHDCLRQINLMHAVARDPVAVARAFHRHVSLFLTHLLDCNAIPEDLPADGCAVQSVGGILGSVAAFYGVTEPQLRGSLHVHMLLHLYAFTSPALFIAKLESQLPQFVRNLLDWVASCVQTSVEALPTLWGQTAQHVPLLQHLQPLPYSQRQRERLQQESNHSWNFEIEASQWGPADPASTVMAGPPWIDPFNDDSAGIPSFLPWPRKYISNMLDLNEPNLNEMLLYDVRHATVHCCLHDCRARTCHKGALGKQGFCRLGFWYWKPCLWETEPVWQRCHGLPFVPRPCVGSVPPHLDVLLTERHHAYVTRFNASMLATTKCNHDVNVLIRAPSSAEAMTARDFAGLMASSIQLATFYITAYMSKIQPHLISLWDLLETGHRRLQEDLCSMGEAAPLSDKYVAKRVLLRMMSATQRRVHKSLPEICHYLLGFPEAYTSHTFRTLANFACCPSSRFLSLTFFHLIALPGNLFMTTLLDRAALLTSSSEVVVSPPQASGWVPQLEAPANESIEGPGPTDSPFVRIVSQDLDYVYRGPVLASWPLYFYVAAVRRISPRKLAANDYAVPFDVAHPHAGGHVQKVLLLDHWAIPHLVGRRIPTQTQNQEQRALALLVLLKPWRQPNLQDLLCHITDPHAAPHSSWTQAWQEFCDHLQQQKGPPDVRPPPFTPVYWAHRLLDAVLSTFCGFFSFLNPIF